MLPSYFVTAWDYCKEGVLPPPLPDSERLPTPTEGLQRDIVGGEKSLKRFVIQ